MPTVITDLPTQPSSSQLQLRNANSLALGPKLTLRRGKTFWISIPAFNINNGLLTYFSFCYLKKKTHKHTVKELLLEPTR